MRIPTVPETNVPASHVPPASPTAASAPEAPALGGVGSATALALTMFVEAVGYGMVAPTLPFLARQAGAGERRIGFLVGLYAAVGLLAAFPFGALVSRHGRRLLVLLGLGCLTVASIGFVLAPTYSWLVAARFAQGLGATAIWVGALTMAADLSSDHSMGRSLSWVTASWSLGFVVGPALGGIGGVRFPFLLYALLSASALLAVFLGLPETGPTGTRPTLSGIGRVLRQPAVLASAAATFALSFFYGAVEAFVPLMLDRLSVERLGIGILFAVAGLPSIFLPRLTGALADRLGDVRVIIAGLAYAAALCAAFLLMIRILPLWIAFLMLGLVEVLVYLPAIALLNRGMSREDRIFATGSHSYAFSSGFFLGPFAGGLLLPLGGDRLLFATLAAVTCAGIACVLAARRFMPSR